MNANARDRFLALLRATVRDQTLTKLTLGRHRGADATLKNLTVRFVTLQAGTHLSLVWRHATNDLTKNFPPAGALALLEPLIGGDFLDAHLFTAGQIAQFSGQPDGTARLRVKTVTHAETDASPVPGPTAHDQPKAYPVPADAPWLRALGITNDHGQPRAGMADKFRQIQKFAELLTHLLTEAGLTNGPLRVEDMGAGKGYLTFATAALLGPRASVRGVEQRPELVALCNRVAAASGFANLAFAAGKIGDAAATCQPVPDVLIALHACDTATD
ncbi:MAG: SAM-dependent methyltransferase, partial [Verrucomicrobiota bacterium]